MYTVAEHSRKDTDMNIAVSTQNRGIAVSIQGRDIAIKIAVSIRSRNITASIRINLKCSIHTGLPVRWTIIEERCPTIEGDYTILKSIRMHNQ